MRYSLPATALITLALTLGACSYIDAIRQSVAEYTARAVVLECALSPTERHTNLAAVNGWLATNGRQARAVALDCDGDGSPDL